ncbi:restriction endonuclease subunit S [Roseinatronobacter sp.]|uniref:restriction endonuclease subunit S n=1 Tax=Roseinatronobacter sp. TaxID=1945755 RepID=UPI0025F1B90F|nr:restriction endonuclease subunit S [Roseibaca sp.]
MNGPEWSTSPFGELPLEIIDGDRSANYPKRSEFVSEGVPFLNSTNILEGHFDATDLDFISEEKTASIKKGRAKPGDIVMTTRGSIGKVAVFPSSFPLGIINAQMLIIRSDPEQLDQRYLFHVMRGPEFQGRMKSFASGSAQPQIPIRDLKHVPVLLPPLPTQQRIAAILSAYDDLIETNTRRIAILEEMARRLYEEWFVHFRFPGHEEVEFDGDLPKGWSVKTLNDIASVNPEAIKPKTAPERINYIDIASVSPGRINSVQELAFADAPGRARRKVTDGDVIWSCVRPNRRSHALVLEPAEDTVASTGFAVLRAKEVPFSFLLASVTTDAFVDYLTNHATGAAYPAVKQSDFEASEFILPERRLIEAFDRTVEPMLRYVHKLDQKNANLRAQRDLLLPKLVSGEIDVSGAEAELEAAE